MPFPLVRAIQDLAGHQDLSTTQRYMHLSPAAIEGAIRLLDHPTPVSHFGDTLETGEGAITNVLIEQERDGGGGGSRTLLNAIL